MRKRACQLREVWYTTSLDKQRLAQVRGGHHAHGCHVFQAHPLLARWALFYWRRTMTYLPQVLSRTFGALQDRNFRWFWVGRLGRGVFRTAAGKVLLREMRPPLGDGHRVDRDEGTGHHRP